MNREYPCIYYDNGRCKKFNEPGYIDYCVLGPCAHETPSNADRIRAMSGMYPKSEDGFCSYGIRKDGAD